MVSYKQPSGMSAEAENLLNLTPGYYQDKARGKTQDEIDVYPRYIWVSDYLKPVFARQFKHKHHLYDSAQGYTRGTGDRRDRPGLSFGAALFRWTGRGVYFAAGDHSFDEGLTTVCERKLLPPTQYVPGCPVITVIDPCGVQSFVERRERATDILRSTSCAVGRRIITTQTFARTGATTAPDGWTPDGPRFSSTLAVRCSLVASWLTTCSRSTVVDSFRRPIEERVFARDGRCGLRHMYLTHGFRYEDATAIDEHGAAVNSQQQSQPMDSYTGY